MLIIDVMKYTLKWIEFIMYIFIKKIVFRVQVLHFFYIVKISHNTIGKYAMTMITYAT